jgi:hypothetical protein
MLLQFCLCLFIKKIMSSEELDIVPFMTISIWLIAYVLSSILHVIILLKIFYLVMCNMCFNMYVAIEIVLFIK